MLALLYHDDQATLSPLDVGQWTFYVVPTWFFDARTRNQHSITPASLKACALGEQVLYEQVAEVVRRVAALPAPAERPPVPLPPSDPSARLDA